MVLKAAGDSAFLQHVFNSAVRIGNDSSLIARADLMQLFNGAGANRVPVAGVANRGDELIAEGIVLESDFGEQLRVEHPPEAVVGAAVCGHHAVELVLGSAFQIAQVFAIGYDAGFDERGVNTLAIGE